MLGGYGEIGYEVLQWIAPDSGWTVEPFVRAEYIDTQYDMPSGFDADKTQRVPGLHGGHVGEADSQRGVEARLPQSRSPATGQLGDEVNLGIGVVF